MTSSCTSYSTSSRRYAQKMYNICLTAAYWSTVDHSRHYKSNVLTDEKVLRLSATLNCLSHNFCRTSFMFAFTLIDMWLEYCDCGQCECGTSRNGRGLLPCPTGDNSHGPRPSLLKLLSVIEYLTSLFDVNDDVIFYLHFTSIAVNKLLLWF